ncbi:MAG: gliding motility-associated-like protein [Saprospiraceae bacterium]|jgi:gliding motility-associated-like protein
MFPMRIHIITVLLALMLPIALSGQVITVKDNKTSGCAPLNQVEFSYPTTGIWDFGDGASGSGTTVTNSYISPGTYNVTISQSSLVVATISIEVFGNPGAAFNLTGNAAGCVPLTTSFQDVSTGGGGTNIVDWKWAFGDGGADTVSAPTYTYTIVGTYSVSLIVIDENGCDSSIKKMNLISVTDAPTSSFTTTPNPASACVGPLTVSFTNNSVNSTAGTSDITYLWDFGNGQTSTDANPAAVTYTAEGTYVVSLDVTEAGGCTVRSSRVVNIGNPVAIPNLPDTVCLNTFINGLGNNSVGANSYVWNFAGGPTYNTKNPNHTFNVAGDQQITLTANSSQGCSDDSVFTVHVEDPSVDFVRNPTYLCQEPYCFDFDGQSSQTNIASWTWGFGDGAGVVGRSEDTTYCYYINDTVYHVHDPYYYSATVQIVTTNGCVATQSYVDTIYPVSAFFVPDSSMGCAPVTVTFSDSTRSREGIVNWTYDFGDGTTSNAQNPVHTYTTAGEYEVVLIAENSLGCKDTSFPVTILVGDPVSLIFTVSPSTICVGESVTFTDISGSSDIDYWHYSTNSNKSSDCVTSGTQQWASFDEVGQQDVTFFANYNGCISSTTESNAVTVEGPLSSLRYTGICASPLDYTFIGTIQGATSWDWDFGDGTVVVGSSDSTVNHTYAATGDYTVSLITYNNVNSCDPDTQQIEVNVREITAVIAGDSSLCDGVSYNFSGSTSNHVYNNCDDAYRWDLGDKTPPRTRESSDISFSFPAIGPYTIRLITHDINGCKDTTTQNIVVGTITARIGADTLQGCLPLTIALSDSSMSDTTIVEWLWTSGIFPNPITDPISSNKNTSVTFVFTPTYTVQLIVRDSLGCKDTAQVTVTPLVPDTVFSAITDRTICVGDSVKFKANNENSLSTFDWTFAALGTSTDKSPYFTFNQADTFDITLSVTDTNGCVGQSTRLAYVSVQDYPLAGYYTDQDTNLVICHPANIQYIDSSKGPVINYYWDLGTGGAIINAPTVTPPAYERGTYITELIVETAYGCKDTATKTINVVGPVASFDMSKSLICTGEEVVFTIKDSVDVLTYLWDFGDGTDAQDVSPVSHTYLFTPNSLKTVVKLITKSAMCEYTDTATLFFEEVAARFGLADTSCLNVSVAVTDTSIGADVYRWTVSDGQTFSTSSIPPLTFGTAGVHSVELIIENNLISCTDTLKREILVHPIPSISARDTGYCEGKLVTLLSTTSNSQLTYNWTPSGQLDDPDKASTVAHPDSSTNYTVSVTDTNNCSNTDVANIYIQRSFAPESLDTCVVIGEKVQLGVDKGIGYTYKWEGSTADLTWLKCEDCPTQEISVTDEVDEVNYTLIYTDSLGCFDNEITYKICILPSYTFDVPTAFTPDGDGVNDIVYLRGHGISEVIMFKIFNRWGELVFESTELTEGWDGIYKGVVQNMETYIYKAEVEFYNGITEAKGGSLNLIR